MAGSGVDWDRLVPTEILDNGVRRSQAGLVTWPEPQYYDGGDELAALAAVAAEVEGLAIGGWEPEQQGWAEEPVQVVAYDQVLWEQATPDEEPVRPGEPEGEFELHTAGSSGGLPEDLEFHEHGKRRSRGSGVGRLPRSHPAMKAFESGHHRMVQAWTGGQFAGYLRWKPTGEVDMIHVYPEHQRRGIGTALWDHARTIDPNLFHSADRTGEGHAWVDAERSRPPARPPAAAPAPSWDELPEWKRGWHRARARAGEPQPYPEAYELGVTAAAVHQAADQAAEDPYGYAKFPDVQLHGDEATHPHLLERIQKVHPLSSIRTAAAAIHEAAEVLAADVEDYQGHHAPSRAGVLHDLLGGGEDDIMPPDDFYEKPHLYTGYPGAVRDTARVMRQVRGKPDSLVTMYRAAPPGATHFNTGDWVTLHRGYAEDHARDHSDDPDHPFAVHEVQVPAKHLEWAGDDLAEWGYWGPPVAVGGQARTATTVEAPQLSFKHDPERGQLNAFHPDGSLAGTVAYSDIHGTVTPWMNTAWRGGYQVKDPTIQAALRGELARQVPDRLVHWPGDRKPRPDLAAPRPGEKLPEGLEFHEEAGDLPGWGGLHATYQGQPVGYINWSPDVGGGKVVDMVSVHPEWQRQGVATGLWDRATGIAPDLRHSPIQSPAGAAWAEAEELRRKASAVHEAADLSLDQLRAQQKHHERMGWDFPQHWQQRLDRLTRTAAAVDDAADALASYGGPPPPAEWLELPEHAAALHQLVPGARVSFRKVAAGHEQLHRLSVTAPDLESEHGRQVAHLQWSADTGEVDQIKTEPAWERRGVATALFGLAHRVAEEHGLAVPAHSGRQTDDGAAWARSLQQTAAEVHAAGLQATAAAVHDAASELTFSEFKGETNDPEWSASSLRRHDPAYEARAKGEVAQLTFRVNRDGSKVKVERLDAWQPRRGHGSALMDELQRRYPGAEIDHGVRTADGQAWWDSYSRGKTIERGRVAVEHTVAENPFDPEVRRRRREERDRLRQERLANPPPLVRGAGAQEVYRREHDLRQLARLIPLDHDSAASTYRGMLEAEGLGHLLHVSPRDSIVRHRPQRAPKDGEGGKTWSAPFHEVEDGQPRVGLALHPDMHDELTIAHEAAHVVANGGRPSRELGHDHDSAHGPEWLAAYRRLVHTHAHPDNGEEFDRHFHPDYQTSVVRGVDGTNVYRSELEHQAALVHEAADSMPRVERGVNDHIDWAYELSKMKKGVHRGMRVTLPQDVHEFVHDRLRGHPDQQAQAIVDHLRQTEGLGAHWTADEKVAHGFAKAHGVGEIGEGDTMVVLHAAAPSPEHVDPQPVEDEGRVYAFDDPYGDVHGGIPGAQREVPLKPGAPVHVQAVTFYQGPRRKKVRGEVWSSGPQHVASRREAAPELAGDAAVAFPMLSNPEVRLVRNDKERFGVDGLHTLAIDADHPQTGERVEAGYVTWHPRSGRIRMIETHPDLMRRGVATSLWHHSHQVADQHGLVRPRHSDDRTRDWDNGGDGGGDSWARSLSDTPTVADVFPDQVGPDGRVLLWRADPERASTIDVEPGGRVVDRPWAHAQELLEDAYENKGGYGHDWGTESYARAQGDDAALVAAWFHPEDFHREPTPDYAEVGLAKPGAEGEVHHVEVQRRDGTRVKLPHEPGLRVRALEPEVQEIERTAAELHQAADQMPAAPDRTFDHVEEETGGTKWPTQVTLRAHVGDQQVGFLRYLTNGRGTKVFVDTLQVDPDHQRRGHASALMDELHRRHDGPIDHGDRTDAGKAWWSGYAQGRPVSRGRVRGAGEVTAAVSWPWGPGVHDIPIGEVQKYRQHDLVRSPERIQALVDDVRQNGVRDPLVMTVAPGQDPFLDDGHHTLHAAEQAGLTHVPVAIYPDRFAAGRALIERDGRADEFYGRTAASDPDAGLDEHQRRALDRLRQLPEDMVTGDQARALFAEHGVDLVEEDPWEAGESEVNAGPDTGRTLHHAPDAPLRTSQDYLWRPTLEHFIRNPGQSGDAEAPSTWTHAGEYWINGGHHRLLADRMTHRRGTTVSDRTVLQARTAATADERPEHSEYGSAYERPADDSLQIEHREEPAGVDGWHTKHTLVGTAPNGARSRVRFYVGGEGGQEVINDYQSGPHVHELFGAAREHLPPGGFSIHSRPLGDRMRLTTEPAAPKPRSQHQVEDIDDRAYTVRDVDRTNAEGGLDTAYFLDGYHPKPATARFRLQNVPIDSMRILRRNDDGSYAKGMPFTSGELSEGDEDGGQNEQLDGIRQRYEQRGEFDPMVVVHDGEHHLILDGSHRTAVGQEYGATHMPAYVTDGQVPDWARQAAPRTAAAERPEHPDYGSVYERPADEWGHKQLAGTLTHVEYPAEVARTLYHGSGAQLAPGDWIEPGRPGNYVRRMDHAYATEDFDSARSYAHKGAGGRRRRGEEAAPRIYEVAPSGPMGHRRDARGAEWASHWPFRVVRELPLDPPPSRPPAAEPRTAAVSRGDDWRVSFLPPDLKGRYRELSDEEFEQAAQQYAPKPGAWRTDPRVEKVRGGAAGLEGVPEQAIYRILQLHGPHPGVQQAAPEVEKPAAGPWYHGTTAPRLRSVRPPVEHGRGMVHPSMTDPQYAYATNDPDSAWNYAELAWLNGGSGSVPRVYEVEPTGDVEKDPDFGPLGESRSTSTGDHRSRSPWRVVRQVPMPEHMGRPADWRR